MRRRLSALALSLLLGGAAVGIAAMPAAHASTDDTASVCTATRKTVSDGGKTFATNMEKVGSLAAKGDLQAADAAVVSAGGTLVTLAGTLRKDATNADNASLKAAVNDLAAQLEAQGKQLDGLTSLQKFDSGKLQAAADKVAKACGSAAPSLGPLPTD